MADDPHPHLASLEGKHRALHDAILVEESRPQPDTLRISTLKRAKLRAKDAMKAFSASITGRARGT